jgi:hypothetical protein
MFESWINNMLQNKLKVVSELYLGTEFEHTRSVDSKGNIIDPFVPKYDIMKLKNFTKEKNQS